VVGPLGVPKSADDIREQSSARAGVMAKKTVKKKMVKIHNLSVKKNSAVKGGVARRAPTA
jgi:hypothetical protein